MAIAPPFPVRPATTATTRWDSLQFAGSIWRAPLVPVALALTAGIVWDRFAAIPMAASLIAAAALLAASAAACAGRQQVLSLLYLALTITGLGAAYHHWHRHSYAADDIGVFATSEPRPVKL